MEKMGRAPNRLSVRHYGRHLIRLLDLTLIIILSGRY